MAKKDNLCEGKGYDTGWDCEGVETTPTKAAGNGAAKEVLQRGLNEARRQFYAACAKYGEDARKAAQENLRESLKLFGGGKYWIKGEEEQENYDDDTGDELPSSYCAIGAIAKADGQAEHLARLAANLAAGELFPKRSNMHPRQNAWSGENIWRVELPDVVSVNDNDATRFADVKLIFKKAIELLG